MKRGQITRKQKDELLDFSDALYDFENELEDYKKKADKTNIGEKLKEGNCRQVEIMILDAVRKLRRK